MTKIRDSGAGTRWPSLPLAPAFLRTAPALQNQAIGAAAAASIAITGDVEWADGAQHDLQDVLFRIGATTLVGTGLRISARDPSTAAGPPGRDDGGVDQSVTITPSVGQHTATLSAVRTCAHGARLSLVFDYSGYTSGSVSIALMAVANSADTQHNFVITQFDGTATYTVLAYVPTITLIASDGTIGTLRGCLPRVSAVNAHAINTGTTPDEIALEFTVDTPRYFDGGGWLLQFAANADYELILSEDGTPVWTRARTSDEGAANASVRWDTVAQPDFLCTVGHTYRLHIKPTTANSITVYSIDVTAAAHLVGAFGSAKYAQQSDGGGFAATDTRLPIAFVNRIGLEITAGGLLTHPGMAGGMRA